MSLPNVTANDLLNELESVLTYIRDIYDDSRYERQNVPTSPQANTFVIRFQNARTQAETALTYVDIREWQIIYISGTKSSDVAEVLTRMNGIKRHTAGAFRQVIPINDGSLRYMRVGSFSFGQPFKLENGNHAIIGVLTTEVRKARDFPSYEKIMKAGVNLKEVK